MTELLETLDLLDGPPFDHSDDSTERVSQVAAGYTAPAADFA